jgi:polar amino acid transport system substrate-binding protein
MTHSGQSRATLAAAALIFAIGTAPLHAQTPVPYVPNEETLGRMPDDFTLSYCIDPRDPGWEVDQDIAAAIAGALLVEPAEHVVENPAVREDFDTLYRRLRTDCSLYFGFKLLPGVYPDWLTVTRPYYDVGYVLVVKNPDWTTLADIPPDQAIGPTIGTSIDFRLIQYLNSLNTAHWKRFPQATDESALEALARGEIGAALVWGPSYDALAKAHPEFAGFRTIGLDPLPPSDVPVGAVLLSDEAFLRSSVDQAIASLVADGTIGKILAEHGFQATLPK